MHRPNRRVRKENQKTRKVIRPPRLRPMRKRATTTKEKTYTFDFFFLLSLFPFLFSSSFRLLTFNALLFYHPFSFLSYFFFFFLLLPSYFLSSFQSINQEKHRQDDRSTSRRQRGVQVSTPSLAILSDQAERHCKYCQVKSPDNRGRGNVAHR